MSSLYEQFSRVLNQYSQPDSRFILAFSGGVDSRVMLHLLSRYIHQTGREAVAVHVHHGLSPHADSWAQMCQLWCQEADISFHLHRVKLDKKPRESLESIARQARYEALEHYVGAGDLLLTGQHSDDQLETFLLALKRGSGPKGLSAMGEVSVFGPGKLVRPLLKVSRSDIEDWARINKLDWVEDESNQDTRFDRNFIRHQVSPVLTERWPGLRQAVQRSSELCAEQEALLDELLRQQFESAHRPDGGLSVSVLLSASELVCRRILRMWLAFHSVQMPGRKQLIMLYQQVVMAKADAVPRMRIGRHDIRRFSGVLFCVRPFADVSRWQHQIAFGQQITLPDNLGDVILKKSECGELNQDKLESKVLTIQFDPQGLSACPVNRHGHCKLKKIFQEYHVPTWERRRMPILMAENKVVAVAGLFVDRDFSGSDCDFIWCRNPA